MCHVPRCVVFVLTFSRCLHIFPFFMPLCGSCRLCPYSVPKLMLDTIILTAFGSFVASRQFWLSGLPVVGFSVMPQHRQFCPALPISIPFFRGAIVGASYRRRDRHVSIWTYQVAYVSFFVMGKCFHTYDVNVNGYDMMPCVAL